MSAYRVGKDKNGNGVWWPTWEMSASGAYGELRDATPEESALMEKVIWRRANGGDLQRLRALIDA